MKITFLGTSSMIPTKTRNHSAIFLQYQNEGILIDCGEGTQRQFRLAGISPNKVTKLLITHWHGDHILGIPGLIQNLGVNDYKKTLQIYGPKGTKKYLKNILSGVVFEERAKYEVKEVSKGIFYKDKNFSLESVPLDHIAPTLAYSFKENDRLKINLDYLKKFNLKQHPLLGKLQQGKDIIYNDKKITVKKATIPIKGKKITFISDTAPCKNALIIAKDSDLLISESTWGNEFSNLVKQRKHLTAELAARLAKDSNSKELILTHFSQRYKDLKPLESEAKKVFKNTKTAKDFMEIKI
ncbi:MAG: ribonuclease Z [Nanoarchaeota archaeon]|nr:ribonuclease Z [Nanoarchaeota archaeon]